MAKKIIGEVKPRKPRVKKDQKVEVMAASAVIIPTPTLTSTPAHKQILPVTSEQYLSEMSQGNRRIVHVERTINANNPHLLILYELPSQIVRLHYGAKSYNNKLPSNSYDLSWPHTLWAFDIPDPKNVPNGSGQSKTIVPNVIVSGMREPFVKQGLKTPLFCMPLHNLNDGGNGYICIGTTAGSYLDTTKPITEIGQEVEKAVNGFMASKWTPSIDCDFGQHGLESYAEWEEMTVKNLNAHTEIAFKTKTYKDVNGMLDYMAAYSRGKREPIAA